MIRLLATAATLVAVAVAPAAALGASASDPAGDVTACTGECSLFDQDLKALTAVIDGGNLVVTVEQYGAFGTAAAVYWPKVEIFTTLPDPTTPPGRSFTAAEGDFAIDDIVPPPFVQGMALFTPAASGPRPAPLAAVTTAFTSASSVVYTVPMSAIGNPSSLRLRAYQTSATPQGAVDVLPDAGVLAVAAAGGPAAGPTPTPVATPARIRPAGATAVIGRAAATALRCPAGGGACRGTAALVTASGAVVGTARVKLGAGKRRVVTVRLTTAGRRLLVRAGTLRVTLRITAKGTAKPVLSRRVTFRS